MRVRTALAITFVASLTAWSAITQPAFAQESRRSDFNISSLKLYARQAPNYSGSGTADLGAKIPAANKPWLRIEVEFESDLDWADDVQLRYFVLMGKGKDERLFSGEIVHVNVPKGPRHYSGMFLHPHTLDRFGRGSVERVAVLLYHQNRLMALRTEPGSRDRWWEKLTPSPGYLWPPSRTPWSVLAHEHFEAEKVTP